MNEEVANKIEETNLSRLTKGLLILNLQKEMEEPGYTPIGRITKNRKVVQRRQEYSNEIERVNNEIRLTLHLLSKIENEEIIDNKPYQPEELISYYNGIFLDQVHQIKDKLFRLIALLLLDLDTAQDSQKKDPKEIKYQPFIDRNTTELKKLGVYDLLTQWGSGNLAKVLDKRTNHHHFVSTLRLNDDFQKIKMSRLMLTPLSSSQLSEYGKKRMLEIGAESFEKWKNDLVIKLQEIASEVNENIEQVSISLINHLSIPSSPEVIAGIVNKYTAFLSSMDIKNQTSKEKIQPDFIELVDGIVKIAQITLGKGLASIYLVGSCPRGEFVAGCSDINMYFIFEYDTELVISKNKFPLLNAVFITKKAFLSEEHKKDRFICWSDGILLFGDGIKMDDKDFPKPGTLLCLLLNRGFIEELEKIKNEVSELQNPSPGKLRLYSIRTAKIMLDFDFGVAMSNKPFYTASRAQKIAYTRSMWPNERRTTTLEQIYLKGIVRQEDFTMLIDTFLQNAQKNYEKLLAVETEVKKEDLVH